MNITQLDLDFLKLTKENEGIKHRTSVNILWGAAVALFLFPFKFIMLWYVLAKFSPIIEETAKWLSRR